MVKDPKRLQNLCARIPASIPDELFEKLWQTPHLYVERIVSKGHRSPEGFWYDQDHAEWVCLVQGQAALAFEPEETIILNPGDYILIPAHTRHQVLWTHPDKETIWLAIHDSP